MEYSEYKSILHDIIWVCVFLTAGLIFTTASEYLFSLPLEIALSNTFGSYKIISIIQFIILIVGILLGVIYQLMSQMHLIVDLIRQKST